MRSRSRSWSQILKVLVSEGVVLISEGLVSVSDGQVSVSDLEAETQSLVVNMKAFIGIVFMIGDYQLPVIASTVDSM